MKHSWLILPFLTCTLIDCTPRKTTSFRIASVVTTCCGDTTLYTIVYHSDGNIDSINMVEHRPGKDSLVKNIRFVYSKDSVVISSVGSFTSFGRVNDFQTFTCVDRNSASGLVDSISEKSSFYSSAAREYFHWNGDHLSKIIYRYPAPSKDANRIDSFVYDANGDISCIGELRLQHDVTRSSQPGDPMELNQWLKYGVVYEASAHLSASVGKAGEQPTKYRYLFDNFGRISRATQLNERGTKEHPISDSIIYIYTYAK